MQIDRRQALGIVLARQGISLRAASPEEAVERCLGVQSQYASTVPQAIALRSVRYRQGWAEHQLQAGDLLVKTWSVRYTLHTHLRDDHKLIHQASGAIRYARFHRFLSESGSDHRGLEHLLDDVRTALLDGPLTRRELHERVPVLKVLPGTGWGLDVMGLAYLGELALAGSGEGVTRFRLHDPPPWREPEEAAAELLQRYLRSYAPATLKDFAYWCGIPRSLAVAALSRAGERIERVQVGGLPYLWPSGEPPAEAPLPRIRLLPKFDALLMGYHDKSLFLPEHLRSQVYRKAGQVEAVVLKRGVVAATWRLKKSARKARFEIEPYVPLRPLDWQGIEREAQQLARRTLGLDAEVVSTSAQV